MGTDGRGAYTDAFHSLSDDLEQFPEAIERSVRQPEAGLMVTGVECLYQGI